MIRRLMLVLALALPLAVHAKDPPPQPFVEVPNFTFPAPPADQAQLVFLEPINKIQGMFPVGIFKVEIDSEKLTLLNVSSWKSKSVITLPPGKHLLASAHGWHFMEANVEAGKRYYVLLRFIYGNGLQLRPLRASGTSEYRVNGPDFQKWVKATNRFVEKSPDAEKYFGVGNDVPNVGLQKGIENWQAKSAAEIAELTLNADDAVPL
jgi:hypothetical protein